MNEARVFHINDQLILNRTDKLLLLTLIGMIYSKSTILQAFKLHHCDFLKLFSI